MSASMNSHRIWKHSWRSALIFLALALPVRAQLADWSVEFFRSEIKIHSDASITVTEIIQTEFSVNKHGIFRTIPFRYETNEGDSVSVPISVERVTRNGDPEPYAVSITGNEIEIKIGDADVTVTGPQRYELTYTAAAAVNFFEDHDELYWNVTGDDWEVPLEFVEASIRLDTQVSQDRLRIECFTGQSGSTAQNCTPNTSDSAGGAQAENQYLTVVFGWPKGVVAKPDNYDSIRAGAGRTALEKFLDIEAVFWALNVILPLLAIGWVVSHWLRHGRDPRGKRTMVAQYEPPAGLTPGEMGTIFDERANHRDVVATIVDLAVRGHLTITEVKSKKLLGTKTDFQLDHLVKPAASELKSHEKKLLAGLFAGGDSVKLSDLTGSFHDDVRAIQSELYDQTRAQGFFYSNPNTVRMAYIIVGSVLMLAAAAGFAVGLIGPFFIGLAVALVGPFMPKRTVKGAEALWHAKGFKLFLEKAEKHRIQWQEKQHIFEQYLPYAMAFGVAEKWSKTFAGIQQAPPNWYHGTYGSNFNTLLLWSSLNSFSTTTVKSFSPPAASGGSGFGGGGFSGGGFGGGGGGSW